MLLKLRLDQSKEYEQSIAAKEIAEMLVAYVQGREHIHCIGVEQGIEKWDDFIIKVNATRFHHIQAKNQHTSFCEAPCERDTYKSGARQGQLRDLSALDESMESLAHWFSSNGMPTSISRKFILQLPVDTTLIKKDLQVRHVHSLCHDQIKSISNSQDLEELSKKDASIANCYKWLTTWCGFSNWEHILKAFSCLEINQIGNTNDIDNQTKTTLSFAFNDTELVLREIKQYTLQNSTYAGAMAPRQILNVLKNHLLPSVNTWTQFDNVNSTWKISGIHDLEFNTEIERPSKVVPLLWKNERPRLLKINASIDSTLPKLYEEVFQLALHLRGTSTALCNNWLAWKECIKSKIGYTLGISDRDFEDITIGNNTVQYEPSEVKNLNSYSETDAFAKELRDEMTKETWLLVNKELNQLIQSMDTSELKDAVETRWKEWKRVLGQDLEEQKRLFKKILHPDAEGQDIHGELRIGAKTTGLISKGIFLMLIVSVALNQNSENWKTVENNLSMGAIGLNLSLIHI